MPDDKIKVTYDMRPMAKARLIALKDRLLAEGHQASTSSLLERLLEPEFIEALEAEVKRKGAPAAAPTR